jgi:hypothetical protein
MASGGDRVPSNPAPVSNPGAGSARTDGQAARFVAGVDNASDFQDIESSAKINKSGVTLPQGRSGGAPVFPQEDIVPLTAKTTRPDEPVSAGSATGAGPSNAALASTTMLAAQNDQDIAKLAALLPVYQQIAESPSASNATRNYVRWIESQVMHPQVNQ